jgi:hypothetical protein
MSLTADQRRALQLLANDPHGVTEALMLAHGFRGEMLAGLVLAGLAMVVTETMRAGAATIRVEKYRITEIGRKALAAEGR